MRAGGNRLRFQNHPHGAPVVRNADDLDSDPDRLLTVSEVAAQLAVCGHGLRAMRAR